MKPRVLRITHSLFLRKERRFDKVKIKRRRLQKEKKRMEGEEGQSPVLRLALADLSKHSASHLHLHGTSSLPPSYLFPTSLPPLLFSIRIL